MKGKIIFILAFLAASSAQAGLSGIGIGIHGGIISGYDNPVLEDTLVQQFTNIDFDGNMTNLGMHVNIGTLRIIEFDASLDYAWKTEQVFQDVDLSYKDFSITGSVRKSFPLAVLKPYAGVGGGIHAMSYTIESAGAIVAFIPGNETKTGFHFKVGLELDFPVFPLTPMVEWKYNIIQTSDKSTKYNSINIGLSLDLP